MSKLLKLLKYLEYVELFEQIGNAINKGKKGDDFYIEKAVSIKGRKKRLEVSLVDIEAEVGQVGW
jgi:hypothetical protein